MSKKDLEPRGLSQQDMFSKGETTYPGDTGDIEKINKRAEDSVSDYEFGPKWLPGKNVAGDSGGSGG